MGAFYFKSPPEFRETFFRSVSVGAWGETPHLLIMFCACGEAEGWNYLSKRTGGAGFILFGSAYRLIFTFKQLFGITHSLFYGIRTKLDALL